MKNHKTLKTLFCMLLSLLIIFSNGSTPAAAASSPVTIAIESEWEVLKILNQKRLQEGLQALSLTSALQDAADARVAELQTHYSHIRPNGSNFLTVLSEYSIVYGLMTENIAAGDLTADAVMKSWMNNQGDKDNILDVDYQHIGIGHSYSANSDYGNYWVQLFVQSNGNTFSDLDLYGGQSQYITLSDRQTLSDLNLALQCTSSVYGTCYLPLIDEMCTGFDSTVSGVQTVTVNYQGLTLILYVDSKANNSKASQSAPAGLQSVSPSSNTASDGEIIGVSSDMEYRPEGSNVYIDCSGSHIENLTAGIYYVRYKETDIYNASPDTTVVISYSTEKADQAPPTGLQTVSPSSAAASDGQITGVSADMEYRSESSSAYTACTGSSIDNLTAGTYYVRYKETDTYNASTDTAVVISYFTAKADQAPPSGLQAVSPSSSSASDGQITGVSADMEYHSEGSSAYIGCTGSSIDSLTTGTYYVRYKETDTYNASTDTAVVISYSTAKADQAPPTGLQAVSASSGSASDGQITGVSADMEYRFDSSSVYIDCTGSSIENLAAGIYHVRYKETDTHNASPDTAVVISFSQVKADQAPPSGLQSISASSSTASDGRITGASTDMEYRSPGGTYTGCVGSSIDNLTAGTYYVRYKETNTHNASPDATVLVSYSSEKADQAAPAGLQAIPASSAASSDGQITGVSTDMEYRSSASGTYTGCTGSSIENLTAGTYYVRFKETASQNASPDTAVSVYYQSPDDLSLVISCSGYSCGSDYITAYWRISNPNDMEIAALGAYVYIENGVLLGMYSESYSEDTSGYFELNRETGIELQPGTAYRIILFAKASGFEVTSSDITVITKSLDPAIENPFTDVADTAWYYESVMYVYENKIFAGTTDTTFSPGDTMTRAMMVQALYNLEGASGAASAGFTDVSGTAWYADAVNWAAANKIVAGIGNNLFSPGTPITREEMAVILRNYCEYKAMTLPQTRAYDTFTDQQAISGWAETPVAAMYRAAVLSGMDDGTFNPKGNATRAQVAAMFKCFMEVTGT